MPKSEKNTRPYNRLEKGAKTFVHPSSRYNTIKDVFSLGQFSQEVREYNLEKAQKDARQKAALEKSNKSRSGMNKGGMARATQGYKCGGTAHKKGK